MDNFILKLNFINIYIKLAHYRTRNTVNVINIRVLLLCTQWELQ